MKALVVTLAVLSLSIAGSSGQTQQESVKAGNDRIIHEILVRIAGHENDPAEQVFKNIQMFKGLPARQVLGIMVEGYATALGVACSHCHVTDDFASEEKRPKRAAREMAVMHRSINQQLAKMENLATPPTENRSISCIACHRGTVNPRKTGG